MAPSSPLVVKMVGMERRQLSWQRGSQAPTINGIARQDLIRTRDRLIQTTDSESRAKAILLAYVNELSVEHTSLLSTYVDNNGKTITNPATNYAQHVETKQFFERLGIEVPGTELPAASNKSSLLDLENRSRVKTSQFIDAQIAHRIVQQHATERLAQANREVDKRLTTVTRSIKKVLGDEKSGASDDQPSGSSA